MADTLSFTDDRRIPASQIPLRFGISSRTFERWLRDPALNFPRPIVINRVRFFSVAELRAWEASRASNTD